MKIQHIKICWVTDKSVFTGKFIAFKVYSDTVIANTVTIPKTHQTFYKKCGKHNPTKCHRPRRARILICPRKAMLLQEAEWLW